MLLIKNGCIHDAVNKEPYIADIVVENGKITAKKYYGKRTRSEIPEL